MPKRFTDTDKWKDKFLRGLQGAYKLLWLYIKDDCDHAGIWITDIETASLRIGEKSIKLSIAAEKFAGKIVVIDEDRWFIPDFIEEQYPGGLAALNPANRTHNSVLQILKKFSLIDKENKPLTSPLQGVKDMDKDKELDKDKEKEEEKIKIDFSVFWDDYDKKVGEKEKLKKKWDKLSFEDQAAAISHIAEYKIAQPEKQFRKNPETYLNNKSWNDEIITKALNNGNKFTENTNGLLAVANGSERFLQQSFGEGSL